MRTYDHRLRSKKWIRGPADFSALQAMATFNSWSSGYLIYPNSIRYWWLVALHDIQWAGRRGELMKHERLAREVYDCASAHRATGDQYRRYSRFTRHLAEYNRDHATVERILLLPREERRRLLLAWRTNSRPLLRKLLCLIGNYRRIRPVVSARSAIRGAQ